MEDPWGSPWTADSPPKLDLPTPPPHAHFSIDHTHHGNTGGSSSGNRNGASPQRLSPRLTPWEDDDAWGGWNEPGKESPWGRSPGLKPLGSAASTRLPSPAPEVWGGFGEARRREDQAGDSGISLGVGARESKVNTASTRAEDIWSTAPPETDPGPNNQSRSSSRPPKDDAARSASPEGPPTMALAPVARPEAVRQSSKVQELVQMFDGIALSQSVSPSPIEPSKAAVNGSALVEHLEERVLDGEESYDEEVEVCGFQDNLVEEPEFRGETSTLVSEEADELHLKDNPARASQEGEEILGGENTGTPLADIPKAQSKQRQSPTTSQELSRDLDEVAWPEDGIEPLTPPEEISNDAHTDQQATVSEASEMDSDAEQQSESAASQRPVQKPTPKAVSTPKVLYAPDLSKLEVLFSTVDASFPTPEPVPDVIIDDTFASISERKAWYHTSRYGSIRKHNLGDDENYVRISWDNSQVRERSIRIVRRWMEEDSIGGRVFLGRRTGAAGSKAFNWDSSAPQVQISELFGRKSHSRKASTISKEVAQLAITSPTVAAFGWSSTTSSPTTAIPEPTSPAKPKADFGYTIKSPTIAPPAVKPAGRQASITSPLSPLGQPPLTVDAGTADEEDDEDSDEDDEWGEMVSSPVIETNNAFPPLADVVDTGRLRTGDATAKDPLVTANQAASVDQVEDDWGANDKFTDFAEPIPAEPIQQSEQSDSWGFGDVDFMGSTTEPAPPARHVPLPTPTSPSTTKHAEDFEPVKSIINPPSPVSLASPRNIATKPLPATPVGRSLKNLPTESPTGSQTDTSKDDEIIANILRGLPDLSYMLR